MTAEEWGIPVLDPEMQAREEDLPYRWVKWATHSRTREVRGKGIHFYTDDRKFSALWKHPDTVLGMYPLLVVEPNYSTWRELPAAVALHDVFRKRSIARYWQDRGMRVLVDLNLARGFHHIGLLGVPPEWRAFATRSHRPGDVESIEEDFAWAASHVGTSPDRLLRVVFGGGKAMREACLSHGWHWVPEDARTVRGLA